LFVSSWYSFYRVNNELNTFTTQVIKLFTSIRKGKFFLLLVAKEAKPFLFKQKETKVNPGT